MSTSFVNVHITTLFFLCFFLRCLRQMKDQRRMWSKAGDFCQHYWTTGRDLVKIDDAGQSFDSE